MNVITYYSQEEVMNEIHRFLRGRWAAIEGEGKRWVRWKGSRPLTIEEPSDILTILKEHSYLKPRSIYGTIEVFKKLDDRSDVESKYDFNVIKATPFIDIDVIDDLLIERAWIYVIEVAKVITRFLCEGEGVCKSVYVLWTGAGAHVRINENSFSEDILSEDHPMNIAFAVTEYTLRNTKERIMSIIKNSGGLIKVENVVGQKRVFTAPLSLHRKLDRAAIAISPENLDLFTLSWTEPDFYKHDPEAWRTYEVGESDDLARKALRLVKGKLTRTSIALASTPEVSIPKVETKVGRFPVMGLLQAARYYLLTGDLERAKSFGLNRAIFYAWAKYYGPARSASRKIKVMGKRLEEEQPSKAEWVEVAGERVKVSKNGWFIMGDVEQRPEDFDRNIARKFEAAGIKFEDAWKAALEYVSRFPPSVLENPQRFFKEVYEPVRDSFVERVLNAKWEPRPRFNLSLARRSVTTRKREVRPVGLDKWLRRNEKGNS